jgi:predicted nucleic acid-binding protein
LIVLDTSFLYALLSAHDQHHDTAAEWYSRVLERLTTTPLVLAEVDYLVRRRGGVAAAAAFRRDVRSGAFEIDWWSGAAGQAAEIAEQYAALDLSLTDASLISLAARLRTLLIATFDERDFRAVRPLTSGEAFTLLPQDAPLP